MKELVAILKKKRKCIFALLIINSSRLKFFKLNKKIG